MSKPESNEKASEELTFDDLFDAFAKFGDRESEGITLRNIDKWLKQANLNKEITTVDTSIAFAGAAQGEKKLSKEKFKEMLDKLAKQKKMDVEEIHQKLADAGPPSVEGTTTFIESGVAAENMKRLTDPSKYTGTHKERFDEEGKGKGIEGRSDVADADGYVQGYKAKDTYGSKVDEKSEKRDKKKDDDKDEKKDEKKDDDIKEEY